MAESSNSFHEPFETLSPETRDMHRALVTVMEELEAVDWYEQRAEACGDPELKEILLHNRDEEIEHAMMTIEWIRRKSPAFDERARTYLFSRGPITALEKQATSAAAPAEGSLGIGGLRGK